MTTQEILTRVNDAASPFAAVEASQDSRGYSAEIVMREMNRRLRLLAADLEAQLRQEIAASHGTGNAARIIASMLKAQLGTRESLAYPWIDAQGRQCACDGFQAYRLREHMPLPERPENAGEPIDLDRIFPPSLTGWKELPMPSAKELRAFIAVERAKWTGRKKDFNAAWSFGDHAPSVNAQYLLNAATVFPAAKTIYWNTLYSPLVLPCDAGDAIVMPIRDKNKIQAAGASEAERKAIEEENARKEQLVRENEARASAIRKARDDAAAALEQSKGAQYSQLQALHEANKAEKAGDTAAKEAAMQAYYTACENDAKARINQYAATMKFDPAFSVELVDFEAILRKLYAREYAA